MYYFGKRSQTGFTLIELSIVVAILAVLALLAVPRCFRMAEGARVTTAQADLTTLKSAFLDPDHGYLHDLEGIPGFSRGNLRLANLFMPTNVFGCKVVKGSAYNTQIRAIRVDEGSEAVCRNEGRALPQVFTTWDATRQRGWHGPYVKAALQRFPAKDARRTDDDATFAARGFYPSLQHLRLPAAFNDDTRASIYGFVDEPALLDPWGNPYVLQIPPPQAFAGVTNVADSVRFSYARVVSAGPNGILETPCYGANGTNFWGATGWTERQRRLSRQAGLIDQADRTARGDDLVLFLLRNDIDEGRADRSRTGL